LPEHDGEVRPGVAPKVPTGQLPEQAAVDRPFKKPKVPGGHRKAAKAGLPGQYDPRGQMEHPPPEL
jgi:hypothetical protein